MAEPLSYREISERYKNVPRKESLADWAAKMNALSGTDRYTAAMHDPLGIKRVSSTISKYTNLPFKEAYGHFGEMVGGLVGAPEEGRRIGETSGRTLANFAPLLIPGGGPWAAGAKLAATGLLTGAGTYEETGSPTAGVISGATAAAMPGVANKAEQFALKRLLGAGVAKGGIVTKGGLEQVEHYFPKTLGQKIGAATAGQVAAAALGEAGTKVQQLASGEPLTSPFTAESLLSQTLGQVPFAAVHLGGRAAGLIKSPKQRGEMLQARIDADAPVVAAHEAKMALRKLPDVSKDAPETPESIAKAEQATKEAQTVLSRIRGEQFDVKNDPNLSETEKFEKTNKLLLAEQDVLRKKQRVPFSIFGNTITEDAPRTEILGREVQRNKAGTWRAVLVSDDPSNPPELVGHVVGYSTHNEPAPVYGVQSMGGGGVAKFSLPDKQWYTPKPLHEWNAQFRRETPAMRNTREQVEMEKVAFPAGIDPTMKPLVDALNRQHVFTQGSNDKGDLTYVGLYRADVDTNNLPPGWSYNEATGALKKEVGGELKPEEIPQILKVVKPRADQVPGERAMDLPIRDEPLSDEELSNHLHEIEKIELEVQTAQTTADAQAALLKLNNIQNGNDLPASDDASLIKTMEELTEKGDVDPNQVEKVAVVVEAKRTAKQLRMLRQIKKEALEAEKETQEVEDKLPDEEMGKIAEEMGGKGTFSVRTLKYLSHKKSEDKTVDQIIADNAMVAVGSSKEAADAFKKWKGSDETTLQKDAMTYMDILSRWNPVDLPYDEVAKYLNSRLGLSTWNELEVRKFMIRPHVQLWTKNLDTILERYQKANAAPIVGTNPMVLGLPKAFAVTGQKDLALIDDPSFRDKIVSGFTGSGRMIDAFSGSGVMSRFARWAGHTGGLVENTIPVKGRILERIKNDPNFGKAADDLGKQLVALGEDYPKMKALLQNYPDKDVALFIANNSSLRGREVTDIANYTPHDRTQFFAKIRNAGELVDNLRDQIGDVTTEDGWQQVGTANRGDFVVIDPTYVGSEKTRYERGLEDTELSVAIDKVGNVLKPASDKGVKILYTNAWNPELAKALEGAGFNVEQMQRRDSRPELVATNYTTEEGVSPAPPIEGKGIPAGGGLVFGLKPLDQIQGMTKTGILPETKFANVGSYAGAFSKGEMDLMRMMVPEAFSKGNVDVNALTTGLRDHGPILEVVKSGDEGYDRRTDPGVLSARIRAQELQHELETKGYQVTLDMAVDGHDSVVRKNGKHVAGEDDPMVAEFYQAVEAGSDIASGATGPGQYGIGTFGFVGPKPEEQMPGLVTGLVRLPSIEGAAAHERGGFKYKGPHFGTADVNVVVFFRGYEETLPSGEKAFHVIEIQSDWGQKWEQNRKIRLKQLTDSTQLNRGDLQRAQRFMELYQGAQLNAPGRGKDSWMSMSGETFFSKEDARGSTEAYIRDRIARLKTEIPQLRKLEKQKGPDHPLLEAYNGLGLKSAINHAQSVGATKIIISDAETAMMSEGHDKVAGAIRATPENVEAAKKLLANPPKDRDASGDLLTAARQIAKGEDLLDVGNRYFRATLEKYGLKANIPQEKGMRLHYDEVLPSAAEKLTKSKGQEVDLGIHKSALDRGGISGFEPVPNEAFTIRDRLTGEEHSFTSQEAMDDFMYQQRQQPVGSPAFGGKTSITGRMYDLAQVPSEFTVMGRSRELPPAARTGYYGAKNQLEQMGYTVRQTGEGEQYIVDKMGNPVPMKVGSDLAKLVNAIKTGPPTVRWEREPVYIPEKPGEIHAATNMGFDPTTGTMDGNAAVRFLMNHDEPFYVALGNDLLKNSPEALQRVLFQLRDSNGSYLREMQDGFSEATIAAHYLESSTNGQAFVIAHELIHGLTAAQIDNPLKRDIVVNLDALRQRLIDNLSPRLNTSFKKLQTMDWYTKYAWGEIEGDMSNALGLKGKNRLTHDESQILYGLMTTKEMAAQAFTSGAMLNYMHRTKAAPNVSAFRRFTNLARQLLGISERVPENAFEEFLSHTEQLLEQGDYLSSFNNYANDYFGRLGQSNEQALYNSKRALGLLNDTIFGTDPAALLTQIKFSGLGRVPEISFKQREMTRMFFAKGEDFTTTASILGEHAYASDAASVDRMMNDMMVGEVPNYGDILNTLPPQVTDYIYANARDARQILGVIADGVHEQNKGVLNIANPELLRAPIAETIRHLDNVLKYEKVQTESQAMVDAWEGIPPSGHLMKVMANPEILPSWQIGADKTKSKDSFIHYFLEPIGQWARRVPEIAEAVSKGWQLAANGRKMASEALKVFGTDLTTMEMSKASVKLFSNILKVPQLTKAADAWLWTNQKTGKAAESVTMLDANHPDVQKILAPFSLQERSQIEEIVQKHQISQQQMQAQILEKMLQIAATRGGVVSGMPIKEGTKMATTLFDALKVDRTDPNAAKMADTQISAVQAQMQPEQFLNLVKYAEVVIGEWKGMQELYQKNPAWSSGQRYGKFLVTYKRGKKVLMDGVDSQKEAEDLAEGGTIIKFEKNRKGEADAPPALGPDSVGMVKKLREFQERQYEIMLNSGRYTQDDIADIRQWSPVEAMVSEEAYQAGVPRLKPEARGLTKGAEELPWFRNHLSWVKKTSTYWSRQLFRAEAHAQLLDPEISQNPELYNRLKTHYGNMLVPDTPVGKFFQRATMGWFLGFNPASALVNATQPFVTHTGEFTAMTGKPVDSYRRVIGALKDVANYYRKGKKWDNPDEEWAMHESVVAGEVDLAMHDDDAAAQESIHTNYKRILDGHRTQTTGQRLGTLAGSVSTTGMWMFRAVERVNNMAAILSGFRYYKEQGLDNQGALEKAWEFSHAVNYGGGPAQRSTGIFAGRGVVPRTAAMLATSMQSYVLGSTFQIGRYIQKGFFRPEGLTPGEVYNARKAAVQMLSVQLASAGVLGLPFVSGALAALNTMFPDLEVNKHLREWMDALLGGDEENGSILTDAALIGAPSMFGWDLQSRLSMGNTVPGVSEINGFDPSLLMGAPANMVTNFVKGGQKVVAGDISAIDKFVPPALKKIAQYVRKGGVTTDYRDRPLFTPTTGEVLGMAVGFQPTRLTKLNAAARMSDQAQDLITRRTGEFHQQMAEQVLKGNFGSVRGELQARMRDEKFDPRDTVRAIAQAAEDLTFTRDLRREGTVASGDARAKLLRTFNLPQAQPDEMQRLQFRHSVEQRLGLPVSSGSDLRLAQTMDQLRRQNPEAPRSEIRRQAERLLRGPRLRTLASPVE